jgi:hypothetical protein
MVKTLMRLLAEGVTGMGLIVAIGLSGSPSAQTNASKTTPVAQEEPQEAPQAVPTRRPAIRLAALQRPVQQAPDPVPDEEGVLIKAGDPRLDPGRLRPNHDRFCTPHNGCHEVCNEPHPIYSREPGVYSSGEYKKGTYSRCATCTPSRAQLLWISRLSNEKSLRNQYSDEQIIQYFGSERLTHLTGDYLPPNLDPRSVDGTIR